MNYGDGYMEIGSWKVRDFMTETLTVSPLETVSRVVGLIRKMNACQVFVPEQSRVGVVTIRDLLKMRSLERAISPLSFHVPLLDPEVSIEEAARLIGEHRIHALPIGQKEKILGQISTLTICSQIMQRMSAKLRIGQVMTPNPITIDESDKIAKARDIMIRREIDHLPVLSERRLAGILTSSDIVYAMIPRDAPRKESRIPETLRRLDLQAGGLMSTQVETCQPDDDVLDVLRRLVEDHVTHSVVVLGEEIQGIVTVRDFMKTILQPKTTDVPTYIVGLPDDLFEAEAAKQKFQRVIQRVRRSYPDLLEARAIVKQSHSSGERQRYEVEVRLNMRKGPLTYSETGWDLPAIFDVLANRLKRSTVKRVEKRRRFTRPRRNRR